MRTFWSVLFVLVGAITGLRGGESFTEAYTNYGRFIVTQFVSAPFPHPARAEGHKYKDRFYPAAEHYADSTVALFIPKEFRESESVDFVIHFHGWNNSVAGTVSGFHLIEQFVESRRNAVFIVPEGPRDASDSFGGKLEDPDGFKRFMAEAVAVLQQRAGFSRTNFSVGNIILSGHSGGYRVISGIVDRGGMAAVIREVWLFDALYAEPDKFLAWARREHGRLLNIYTDHGGTKDDSEAMMVLLKKSGTPFLSVPEASLTAAALRTNQFVFIHSDLGHSEVIEKRREFAQFLRSSVLGEIGK